MLRTLIILLYVGAAAIVSTPAWLPALFSSKPCEPIGHICGLGGFVSMLNLMFEAAVAWAVLALMLGAVYAWRRKKGKPVPWWLLVALADVVAVGVVVGAVYLLLT